MFSALSAFVCICAAFLPSCLHVLQMAGRGETKSVANGEFSRGTRLLELVNGCEKKTHKWEGRQGELVAPKKHRLVLSLATMFFGFFFVLFFFIFLIAFRKQNTGDFLSP